MNISEYLFRDDRPLKTMTNAAKVQQATEFRLRNYFQSGFVCLLCKSKVRFCLYAFFQHTHQNNTYAPLFQQGVNCAFNCRQSDTFLIVYFSRISTSMICIFFLNEILLIKMFLKQISLSECKLRDLNHPDYNVVKDNRCFIFITIKFKTTDVFSFIHYLALTWNNKQKFQGAF